jgi:hypothetical protein
MSDCAEDVLSTNPCTVATGTSVAWAVAWMIRRGSFGVEGTFEKDFNRARSSR